MLFQIIKKHKILILRSQRCGTDEMINLFSKKYKNTNIIIEDTLRRGCINIDLIGEKLRGKGGSFYYWKICDTLKNIPIDEFKKYKIFWVMKNPFERLLSFFEINFLQKTRYPNKSFENLIDSFHKYFVLNETNSMNDYKYRRTGWMTHICPQTDYNFITRIKKSIKLKYNDSKFKNFLNYIENIITKKINHNNLKVIESKKLSILYKDLNIDLTNFTDYQNILEIKQKISIKKKLFAVISKKIIKKYKNRNYSKKNYLDNYDLKFEENTDRIFQQWTLPITNLENFYNQDLKNKVSQIYKKDFEIFKKWNYNYL